MHPLFKVGESGANRNRPILARPGDQSRGNPAEGSRDPSRANRTSYPPRAFSAFLEMSCLEGLLHHVARDLEGRVKTELTGPVGAMVERYLPQLWVFTSEIETLTLQIDREGYAGVIVGVVGSPDVTIETGHDRLAAALKHRRRDLVPPGPFKATPHTPKGRMAFNFLRSRLGL